MELSINLSKLSNISYFELLKQDIDEVIWLANYYILKGEKQPQKISSKPKEQRIRVNDDTATGGWF